MNSRDMIAKILNLVKPSNTTSTSPKGLRPTGMSMLIYWVKRYQHGLFIGLCMLLTAGIGYNIGRIKAMHYPPDLNNQTASIFNGNTMVSQLPKIKITQPSTTPADLRVVASKASSSKLYHHPWCSGAQRIKETNKLWFPTENAAISAGYTLAANCQ